MSAQWSKWDIRFLRLAEHIAQWSKDPSTKVGAVITDPQRRVVSTGYNGFPRAMQDNEEWLDNREEKYSRIIHAEMNAVMFARESLQGCWLYTYPFIPCDRCLVHMSQFGISRIFAPVATPEQEERWGSSFNKSRRYAENAAIALVEVDLTREEF